MFALAKSLAAALLAGVVLATGCGPSHAVTTLSGAVSVGGTPVESGQITFTPLDGNKGTSIVAPIVAGRYTAADVPLGQVRADFHATRETGKTVLIFDKPEPEVVNVIPERYATGESFEVTAGMTTRDFPLTTQGP